MCNKFILMTLLTKRTHFYNLDKSFKYLNILIHLLIKQVRIFEDSCYNFRFRLLPLVVCGFKHHKYSPAAVVLFDLLHY